MGYLACSILLHQESPRLAVLTPTRRLYRRQIELAGALYRSVFFLLHPDVETSAPPGGPGVRARASAAGQRPRARLRRSSRAASAPTARDRTGELSAAAAHGGGGLQDRAPPPHDVLPARLCSRKKISLESSHTEHAHAYASIDGNCRVQPYRQHDEAQYQSTEIKRNRTPENGQPRLNT
ncbi:hypothetical protein PAHAL_1G279300 [Panicum hallii]|jgi:hypothetical protein|uniref:Uncharacterized protein n=1 Tax=Panicum hallii TaxID=206008 RepID=A0A2T8KWK5_9POAL|nr:hypothetical protein PAHAL_1G279300 [Panicum hallii]